MNNEQTNTQLFEKTSDKIRNHFPDDNPDMVVSENYITNNDADSADIVSQWLKRVQKNYPELLVSMTNKD